MKELAIGGGGIKGLAFAGALYQLEKMGQLDNLERVSGTSIGSFLAVCLVSGIKMKDLLDQLFEYDFSKIKDIDLSGLLERKSVMKGKNLKEFFKEILSQKINPMTTLEELYKKTKIDLIVPVTCVNTRSVEYINHKTDPELDVFTLISMSSAIPGFLPPVFYKNKLYIDGCVFDDLPMSVLGEGAIGVTSLKNRHEFIETDKINTFTYFAIFLKIIYDNIQKDNNYKNVIRIQTGKVEVTSFNITKDDKLTLINSGIRAVQKSSLFL